MANRSYVKVGDTYQVLTRELRVRGGPLRLGTGYIDPYKVLVSAWIEGTHAADYTDRDVTAWQPTHGNPGEGVVAVPIFTGQTLPGTVDKVTVGAGEFVTVTAGAAGAGYVRQELYMSKAGASDLFLVAEGPSGFLAGGTFRVGDPSYSPAPGVTITGYEDETPGADVVLVQEAPTIDQSATSGSGKAPAPAVPTLAASGTGGTLVAGDHDFAVVAVRNPDSYAVRTLEFELVVVDVKTGKRYTFPPLGYEVVQFVEAIA